VSVSQNVYKTDLLDAGKDEIAALEMRIKTTSRQGINIAAGIKDANFDLDQVDAKNICSDVNQAAFDWALSNASPAAVKRYQEYGKKLVFGDDINQRSGVTWVFTKAKFTDNEDKTETVM